MVNVHFLKAAKFPDSTFEPFELMNRIPFRIDFGDRQRYHIGIWMNIFFFNSFMEIKFLEETKKIGDITMVTVDPRTLKKIQSIDLINHDGAPFECFTSETKSMKLNLPTSVLYSSNRLSVRINPDIQIVKHFSVTKECALGVTENGTLGDILLTPLDEATIKTIIE